MGQSESPRILVVDDERGVRESFNMLLKDDFAVLFAESGAAATDLFRKHSVDLVLLDIRLPDADGLDLLEAFKERDPLTEVVMVTAVKEIQAAVRAIKLGAYEYVVKPFSVEEVRTIIDRALEKRRLVQELAYLRTELDRIHRFEQMVGQDPKMIDIFETIATYSQGDGTVLIQGESGTGKELVARAIHKRSPRSRFPFVVVNCAAIPPTLMESEIFGHVKGAFTGATSTRSGKLEIADKGTVLLDDIDSLDVNMQAKLLRVIQEKELERLGDSKVIRLDVRFLASSNKDIETLIEQGSFREDLYYRLNVLPIQIPPLRERKSDIPLLLTHFLECFAKRTGTPAKEVSDRARAMLMGYEWPGNVRELQNFVERMATVKAGSVIEAEDLDPVFQKRLPAEDMSLKEAVTSFEREFIGQVLEQNDFNRTKAAQKLGIHRNTLIAKIQELGLDG
ncbi:MAG: sigma-54 dependent transcriptional regulator [Desulfobacterales bacterium]|jgi:DNA-binding NtrC family response regulator